MPEFASPSWLPVVPLAILLVWWIHRHQSDTRQRHVSALFPWRGMAEVSAGSVERPRADPAWRRRAVVAVLIAGVLTDPRLRSADSDTVQVWFDNSYSMTAIEQGQARWQLGLAQLRTALDEQSSGRVILHPLYPGAAHPRPATPLSPAELEETLDVWFRQPARQTELPLPTPDETDRWLVSDLSDPAIDSWSTTVGIDRLIPVASQAPNTALALLSLRPALRDRTQIDGIVQIDNRGNRPANGQLVVRVDGETLTEADWSLDGGASRVIGFMMETSGGSTVEAVLAVNGGADARAVDDRLSLTVPADTWRIRATVDPTCHPKVRKLLQAMAGISEVSRPPVDLALRCTTLDDEPVRPTVQITDPGTHPSSGLSVSDGRSSHRLVTVGVRFSETAAAVDDTEQALAVSTAIRRALGRDLRDPVVRAVNPSADSQLAPVAAPAVGAKASPGRSAIRAETPLWQWLAAAVLVLLAFDLWRTLSGSAGTGRRRITGSRP